MRSLLRQGIFQELVTETQCLTFRKDSQVLRATRISLLFLDLEIIFLELFHLRRWSLELEHQMHQSRPIYRGSKHSEQPHSPYTLRVYEMRHTRRQVLGLLYERPHRVFILCECHLMLIGESHKSTGKMVRPG